MYSCMYEGMPINLGVHRQKKASESSTLNMQDLKNNLEVWIFACTEGR